ncbi:hypothetical protein JOC86_003313 [Bacillus pakistanensis]|uniref:Uncharacterized protein n=1 Tax=Rossellomorea pakistanensis TaxID=992288 RepID=A0ABS2NFY1_9BACI|nr:hypothetical protein [Bacillus pakistanensis]MBM7586761.1 hypothetical protein [Bacillus pakistanensis]
MDKDLIKLINELEISLLELSEAHSSNTLVQHYIQEEKRDIEQLLNQIYFNPEEVSTLPVETLDSSYMIYSPHQNYSWKKYIKRSNSLQ